MRSANRSSGYRQAAQVASRHVGEPVSGQGCGRVVQEEGAGPRRGSSWRRSSSWSVRPEPRPGLPRPSPRGTEGQVVRVSEASAPRHQLRGSERL